MLGYPREELIKTTWPELTHTEDLNADLEQFTRVLEGEIDGYSIDKRFIRKDGKVIWTNLSVRCVRFADGKVDYFIALLFDITERRQAEEELSELMHRLEDILENANDGIVTLNSERVITSCNRAATLILGYSCEDLLGHSLRMVYRSDEYFKEVGARTYRSIRETGSFVGEVETIRPDGEARICEISIKQVRSHKQSSGIVGVFRDITERKQAEGQISSLLAEKELLLREVHHRIKNNMNTMISLLTLQAKVMKDPTAASALNDAVNRMRSMGVLYDQLYRSKNLQAMSIRDYLSPLVDEIVGNFPGAVGVMVDKQIDDFMIGVKELSLLGILVNELVTNIMKYAFTGRDGGLITISAEMNDNHVTLAVGDNGIGIPESVDISTTNGFGLKLVGGLAGQINGEIRIERRSGTKFVLDFTL